VPIVAGDEVLCVLVFFMGDARDEDSRLVELVSAIGSHLKLPIKHKQADFIERAQAEAALREQSQLTQTITNNATTAIFMEDSQARRIFMNPPAAAMTGYTFGNWQVLDDRIHHTRPDGRPFPISECLIDQAIFEHKTLRGHADVFLRENGTFFSVRCGASSIFKNGGLSGIVLEE
jgi:PAS domain-containing protein